MKPSSLLATATAGVLLTAAVFTAAAQEPQTQPAMPPASGSQAAPQTGMPPGGRPIRNFPPPTNLQVLPKDTTGQQVREIMRTWAGSLGVECETCHAVDTKNVGPNGRPHLNFADDSKDDKKIARIMYTMTQQINADYISKAMDLDKDDEGSPVTCGTCHRGHKMPETFVIPREGRRGGAGMPGMPAGGAAPPAAGTPPAN